MRRKAMRVAAPVMAYVMLAASAGTAQAATLTLPGACGLASDSRLGPQRIPFRVDGLRPSSPFTVTANGKPVGDGTTDAAGAAVGTFSAPFLDDADKAYSIVVSDGIASATAGITLTTHSVSVKPGSGKPNRRVKIRLFGWLGKTVYMHFIPPHKKKASRTVRLAKTAGPCGHGTKRLPHFYATARPKAGVWMIVFDTARKYKKGAPLAIRFKSTISVF